MEYQILWTTLEGLQILGIVILLFFCTYAMSNRGEGVTLPWWVVIVGAILALIQQIVFIIDMIIKWFK